MQRYRDAMANTRAPHLVGLQCPRHDHGLSGSFATPSLRACWTTAISVSPTSDKGYSSVTWFDEFDFKLGAAISTPPTAAWKNGVWRRDFEQGIALVNPTNQPVTVELEPGFRRLAGSQDSAVNDGQPVAFITLEAKDGIILRRP